jgi:hypothetical protein
MKKYQEGEENSKEEDFRQTELDGADIFRLTSIRGNQKKKQAPDEANTFTQIDIKD